MFTVISGRLPRSFEGEASPAAFFYNWRIHSIGQISAHLDIRWLAPGALACGHAVSGTQTSSGGYKGSGQRANSGQLPSAG